MFNKHYPWNLCLSLTTSALFYLWFRIKNSISLLFGNIIPNYMFHMRKGKHRYQQHFRSTKLPSEIIISKRDLSFSLWQKYQTQNFHSACGIQRSQTEITNLCMNAKDRKYSELIFLNNNYNNNTKISITLYSRALRLFTIKCLKQ